MRYADRDTLSYLIRLVKSYVAYYFVRKVDGKRLSTEDFSTAQKNKLAGIESGAQINVIEAVKINGIAMPPDGAKAVNIDLSSYAKNASVPTKVSQLSNDRGYQTLEQVSGTVQAALSAQKTLTAAEIDDILAT